MGEYFKYDAEGGDAHELCWYVFCFFKLLCLRVDSSAVGYQGLLMSQGLTKGGRQGRQGESLKELDLFTYEELGSFELG